jgi:hypothetical protein
MRGIGDIQYIDVFNVACASRKSKRSARGSGRAWLTDIGGRGLVAGLYWAVDEVGYGDCRAGGASDMIDSCGIADRATLRVASNLVEPVKR